MGSFYLQSGDTIEIVGSGRGITQKLPTATYVVVKSQDGFQLNMIDDMTLPAKLYGSADKRADRILNTFKDRPTSTGVLLQGEKGSGKTLLAKLLSVKLREQGISTVIVNEPYAGNKFNSFIQSIDEECLILFDEFEKVYEYEDQEEILTLLDGTMPSKKLFVFTANVYDEINEYLLNRPGRIYYRYKYQGLDRDFIVDYCQDNLNDKSHIDKICSLAAVFNSFNFDMLASVVEEMNRYGESPIDVLEHLNIDPEIVGENHYEVKSFDWFDRKKSKYTKEIRNLVVRSVNSGAEMNPYTTNGFDISVSFDYDGGDGEWYHEYYFMTFTRKDLVSVSGSELKFVSDEAEVVISKKPSGGAAFREVFK